jgi:mannose-6-phosphate isomerase-like protein (cupin superfamily)
MDAQVVNEKDVEKVPTGQGMTKFLVEHPDRDGPNIMIRYWGAKTDLPIHAHDANELFYILSGEVELDGKLYGPGTCLFVPKGVPYGPIRVPSGEAALLRYYEAEK